MIKKTTGLNRTLYTYKLNEEARFIADLKKLRQTGTTIIVFINNGLAFEYTKNRIIDIR